MTKNKTRSAPARPPANAAKSAGSTRPQPRTAAARPQPAAGAPGVDDAIAKAQQGQVNVTPAKAVEMAGVLFGQRKYAQAERVCRQIVEARPDNADAHNILGVTLNALGRPDEGIEMLRRAIKLAPRAASIHANLGELLRQNGQRDEARKALEQAVKLDPNNAQALNNLGIIQYELKKFAEAADYYRKALAVRPTMAEAFNNLGNALRVLGD